MHFKVSGFNVQLFGRAIRGLAETETAGNKVYLEPSRDKLTLQVLNFLRYSVLIKLIYIIILYHRSSHSTLTFESSFFECIQSNVKENSIEELALQQEHWEAEPKSLLKAFPLSYLEGMDILLLMDQLSKTCQIIAKTKLISIDRIKASSTV